MKKLILGLLVAAATAAIAVPLAFAASPSSPQHATGDVTWNYFGLTGHVSFDANAKTGGSLDYQNSEGGWLHGVVEEYRQIDETTAVFTGTLTDGTYLPVPGHFYAIVKDNGTPGSEGPDQIAVLANWAPGPQHVGDPVYGGPFADVTGGNLVVH
jgi:hypothetical protein